jgi:ABC-type amino acid transport substrate-binding protein
MANALVIIQPYWHEDAWVFDDVSKGLEKEHLEGEIAELGRLGFLSESVDYLVKDTPNARKGFILLLSPQPFAGYQVELTLETQEDGGYLYEAKHYGEDALLSPVLSKYFDTAPESLYIKAEARRAKYDRIREVVALKDRIEKLEQLVGKLTLENDTLRTGKNKANNAP